MTPAIKEKKLRTKKLKKKLKVKKLKRPHYLWKKGESGRSAMNDQTQCHWYDDEGDRCKNFALKNKSYCRWHIGKRAESGVDFDLFDEVEKMNIQLKGVTFKLDEYPQLVAIYHDKSPEITIMKAAQCGVTEWGIEFALHFLRLHRGTTVIYTLPSRALASSVSKLRIGGLCDENARTFLKFKKGKIVTKYDSVYEKQIKDAFLYLQGTWQTSQAISTPGDVLIHDEVDFCKGNILAKFRSRIGNSDYKFVYKFSTPTYPEYGIHKEFLKSDQHHWWYKCEHCGHIFMLCCSWPDVLHVNEETGKPYFGCISCDKEIERKKGWWKAENPGSNRRGYHVTKLASPRVSAQNIVDAKDEYKLERDFWNFELGLPFSGDDDQLTIADIETCEDGRLSLMFRDKHTCAGVDQGGNDLWVVVLKPRNDKLYLVYVDHLVGKTCWTELASILIQLGVIRCVIDAQPDTFKSAEFQEMFKKKVYLAYYHDKVRVADNVNWQPSEGRVTLQRCATLDMALEKVRKQKLVLPVTDKLTDFKRHLISLIKVKREDANGDIHYEYKKVRKDHLAHAYNYANVASLNMNLKSFKVHMPNKSNARRIAQGKYSDDVVNHLSSLLLDSIITEESLMVYRAEKVNGKFVDEMPLTDALKDVWKQLELKHTVRNLLSSVQNIQIVKDRAKLIAEKRKEEKISGGDNGPGDRSDGLS